MEGLYLKGPDSNHIAGRICVQGGRLVQFVSAQLDLNQAPRQAAGIDGDLEISQYIWESPNVVLVSVGDNDCPNLVFFLFLVLIIRDDDIYPVHV